MTNCERCGAALDPTALTCPFCGLTTRAGAQAKTMQEQAAQSQAGLAAQWAMQRERAMQMEIASLATQAMWWSIAGVAFCCLPLGIVGIVQGLRAKGRAQAGNITVPGAATVGLVVGIISCVMSVALITYAAIDSSNEQDRANARVAAIDKQLGKKPEAATLDHDTACLLGEEYTLKNRFDDKPGYELQKFDCVGKLTQTADAAQLEDLKFHYNDDEEKAFVCFKRGTKWYVDRLEVTGCESDTSSSSASASADAAAAPSATTAPASTHAHPHRDPHETRDH
ncbi:MAG: hypothetical protein ACRELY_24770 [Polyangiaceae bacterium]